MHIYCKEIGYQFEAITEIIDSMPEDEINITFWHPEEAGIAGNYSTADVKEYAATKGKNCFFVVNANWPMYWALQTVYHSRAPVVVNYPKRLFTCLNGKPKYQRYAMMDQLAKYDLIDSNYVSFNNWTQGDHQYGITEGLNYWEPKVIDLDGCQSNEWFKAPDCFATSLISLVTETTVDPIHNIFITEKTFMPIYHQRPFIILGQPGIHSYLKKMGFELYEELFDYSFDHERDAVVKAQKIAEQLYRMNNFIDMPKAYRSVRTKIIKNYKHLIKGVKKGIWLPTMPIDDTKYNYLLKK